MKIITFLRNHFMPAVHSCWVCLARFSSESHLRRGCASVTVYTLAVSSHSTWECGLKKKHIKNQRRQPGETLWLGHHRLLKKWELTMRDTSARGYTRASEVRRVFPSTFLLSPCLGFSLRECTAGIRITQQFSLIRNIIFKFSKVFLKLLSKFFLIYSKILLTFLLISTHKIFISMQKNRFWVFGQFWLI